MRGTDHQQADMYSYLSPEMRVRPDDPLRAIRAMSDKALSQMTARFDEMYAKTGRPSIAPEKLLRAQPDSDAVQYYRLSAFSRQSLWKPRRRRYSLGYGP